MPGFGAIGELAVCAVPRLSPSALPTPDSLALYASSIFALTLAGRTDADVALTGRNDPDVSLAAVAP